MNFLYLLIREIRYFSNFQNKMYQFLLFFQPLMFLSIVYFLKQMRGDVNIEKFVVASALISMWSYVLYSSGSALISQKWNDTLKLLIAAPASLFQVILTKTISNAFIALISMILSFTYARFIFQLPIGINHYGLFFLSILVLLASLSVVGMILSIVFVASQNVYSYQNLILTPVILICGVFIPVESLPFLFKWLAYLIPMTWGIQTVYETLVLSPQMYTSMTISILVSGGYFLLSMFIIKRMEMVLRKQGSLGAI